MYKMNGLVTIFLVVTCLMLVRSEEFPLAFYQKLNALNITSAEEFLRLLRKSSAVPMTDDSGLFDPLTGAPTNRAFESLANVAKADQCEPKNTSVPVPADPNPNTLIYPSCVLLERCGGCCGHHSLKCTPISKRVVDITVMKTVFDSPSALTTTGFQPLVLQMEEHVSCQCRCSVRASDCNTVKQFYHTSDCRCKCKNEDRDMGKCHHLQRWDGDDCQCICNKITNCETGMYFNTTSCLCELPQRARETSVNNLPSSGGTNSGSSANNQPSSGGANSGNPADPCATKECGTVGYVKRRVGDICRCVFDLFG